MGPLEPEPFFRFPHPRGTALAGVSQAYLDIVRGEADQAAARLEGIAEAYARSAAVSKSW